MEGRYLLDGESYELGCHGFFRDQELTLLDTIPAIDPALSGKIKYLTVALMFSEAIERIYQEVSISKLFR